MTANRAPDNSNETDLIHKCQLQPGCLYRRRDLAKLSKGINRHLARLIGSRVLAKAWRGVYECPKNSRLGLLAPEPEALVKGF
jgi:hypothetical protein